MLRFKSLHVENAFTLKNAKISLENQGLVLVRGLNGSAKSAIFEVIRHAIFGSTQRGLRGKDIIRDTAKDEGYVAKLEFDLDSEAYTLVQSTDHSKYGSVCHVYDKDAKIITHLKAKPKNQKFVHEELLKLTEDQFDATVFIGQEAAHPFVNGTGTEFSAYISQSYNLITYDEMIEKISIKLSESEKNVKKFDELLAIRDTLLSKKKAQEEDLFRILGKEDVDLVHKFVTDNTKAKEQTKAQLKTLRDKVATLRAQIFRSIEVKNDVEKFRKKLNRSFEDVSDQGLADKLKDVSEEFYKLRTAADQYEEQKKIFKKKISLAEKLFNLKAAVAPVPTAEQISAIERQVDDLTNSIWELKRVASILDKVSSLTGDVECPTCLQVVDSKHIENEIAKAKSASERIVELTAQRNRLAEELSNMNSRITKQHLLAAEIESLEQTYAHFKHAEPPQDAKHLDDQLSSLTKLEREIVADLDCRKRLRELEKTIHEQDSLDSMHADLEAAESSIAELEDRYEKLTKDLVDVSSKLKNYQQVSDEIQEYDARLDSLARIKHENFLRKHLVKALKRRKKAQLHEILNSLQKAMEPYVEQILPKGTKIEVDASDPDSIERWCVRGSSRIPVRALSKGERAAVRLCAVLATHSLKRSRSSSNILVLDEADGGLDNVAITGFGAVLEVLKQEYESVFVISHKYDALDAAFDKTIIMSKDSKNISKMTIHDGVVK